MLTIPHTQVDETAMDLGLENQQEEEEVVDLLPAGTTTPRVNPPSFTPTAESNITDLEVGTKTSTGAGASESSAKVTGVDDDSDTEVVNAATKTNGDFYLEEGA